MVGKYVGLTDSYLSVVKVNWEETNEVWDIVFYQLNFSRIWFAFFFFFPLFIFSPSPQALLHACIACSLKPQIEWIAASDLEDESEKSVYTIFLNLSDQELYAILLLFCLKHQFLLCRLRKHMLLLGRFWRWERCCVTRHSMPCQQYNLIYFFFTFAERRMHSGSWWFWRSWRERNGFSSKIR